MNYIANEIVKILKQWDREIETYRPVYPEKEALKIGISRSASVCTEEEYVHPTPIMKNAMIIYGDVKQEKDENGEWHTTRMKADGKLGNAATNLLGILKAAMKHEFGEEVREYPDSDFGNPRFYYADCWNFYDALQSKFWDVQPRQKEKLKESMEIYSNPKTNLSLKDTIKLIEDNPAVQKALEIENKIWPVTMASRDVSTISDPFMSKKTGVSYPDYHNDSSVVSGTNITYGRYEIQLTEQAYKKGGLPGLLKYFYENNVYTLYRRLQLGKARALIAESRRSNLVINMVNGPEMENVKETKAIQIPFLNEEGILSELSKILDLVNKNKLYIANIDSSRWDQNLGLGPLILQDAERYLLGQGNFTKSIIKARAIGNSKAYIVDGVNKNTHMIYGRMFSGYDDTTLGNTKSNRTISTAGAMATDLHYVRDVIAKMKGYHIITVGDDLLITFKNKQACKAFIEYMNKVWKIVIHADEKYSVGVFFIQWRCFEWNGEKIIAYNLPRVFRSTMSKEDAKHLGRFGWTLAFYQQIGKLVMFEPALRAEVNILAAFDQHHLSLDMSVKQIIDGVKEEDKLAAQKNESKSGRGRRNTSTAERMYNSNPNIAGIKMNSDGTVELDENYFVKVQDAMKKVYDPDYLTKLGFSKPDLSVIH